MREPPGMRRICMTCSLKGEWGVGGGEGRFQLSGELWRLTAVR
jgi:hypothetical protein